MKTEIHIFDVDHTLVNGSSGRHFIVSSIKEGVLPATVLLSLPFVYLRYRLGILKPSHINRELPQVKGVDRATLDRIAELTFRKRLEPAIFSDAVQYLQELQKNDNEIAIATSSVDIIIAPLAERLAISTIISSSMEFDDGNRCTGRFIDSPVFGEAKRIKVLAFLKERGIDPESCAFYSDSVYDLPLLQVIGKPVAVNPDYLLKRHAKREGWEIMAFS